VFEALKRELQDPGGAVRAEALRRLDELCSAGELARFILEVDFAEEVVAAVKDNDPAVRKHALLALRRFSRSKAEAVPALLEALADVDPACREAAWQCLDSLSPTDRLNAEGDLTRALRHTGANVRQAVLQHLRRHPPERASFVVGRANEAMRDPCADVRKAAIELLRHTNPDAAVVIVSALIAALDDAAGEVRREAISTIQWLDPDAVQAVPKLVEVMLGDPDQAVRSAATLAALRIDRRCARVFPALADQEGETTQDTVVRLLAAAGAEGRALRRRLLARWSTPAEPKGEGQAAVGGTPADGPEEPDGLRWGGKRYPVPPTPYRLLEFMWDRQRSKIDDVAECVWGNPTAGSRSIKSALHDVNVVLETAGVPWRLGQKSGLIVKKERLPKGS
jgi:HEAT repeat protein